MPAGGDPTARDVLTIDVKGNASRKGPHRLNDMEREHKMQHRRSFLSKLLVCATPLMWDADGARVHLHWERGQASPQAQAEGGRGTGS